jgi:hypothetical protein
MIFHAVSLIAALVGELVQAPIHVQCVLEQAHDPWWRWLLPTIVQTVVSLASITAGVLIAVWSFRKNRQSEHERWIRDRKIEEWKDLLSAAAEYEQLMPAGQPGSATIHAVRNDILLLCDRIVHQSARTLLIAPTLSAQKVRSTVFGIIQATEKAIGRIELFQQSSPEDKQKLGTPLDNAMEIRTQLEQLHANLIAFAQKDMNL